MSYEQIAHYYDLTHESLTTDIGYILKLAQMTGDPVLELGCGSGRLLLPLARAGYSVIGVDSSPAMLARAQTRLESEPEALQARVRLVAGDMTTLALGDEVTCQLVIVPYNTLMHLDGQGVLSMLRGVRAILGRNGRFFIDLANPFTLAQTPNDHLLTLEASFTDPDTGELVLQFAANRLYESAQQLHITWIYDATPATGGQIRRTVTQMVYHYYYPHQLELMLEETGYQLLAIYGDYTETPFTEESERLLILAERGA